MKNYSHREAMAETSRTGAQFNAWAQQFMA